MTLLKRLAGSVAVLLAMILLLAGVLYVKSGGLPTPLNVPPGIDLAATPPPAAVRCERLRIPVKLGPRGLFRYDIVGELCAPEEPDGRVLQVLLSGSGYGTLYWDFPYQPDRYSYVRAAWQAGYATFNYYRPGLGESDHPFGALLTVDRHAYVLAQLLEVLSQQHDFAGVVTVGHSFGSVTAIAHALARPDQVDGIVLTGFAHNTNPGFIMAMREGVDFAAFKGPFAGKIIDPTYLISKPGMRKEIFYTPGNADPAVIAVDEANRQPTTIGETISASKYFGPQSRELRVPVLLLLGDDDFVVCGGDLDCKNHAATIAHEEAYFGPASCLEMVMLPDTGHDSALHLEAPASFARMLDWVGRRIGGDSGAPASAPCGE